jgi:acyl-coenzyme A synthetase/AMP-(fatty) acid ligase
VSLSNGTTLASLLAPLAVATAHPMQIVQLPMLPRNGMGKLMREELRNAIQKPNVASPDLVARTVAPIGPTTTLTVR